MEMFFKKREFNKPMNLKDTHLSAHITAKVQIKVVFSVKCVCVVLK